MTVEVVTFGCRLNTYESEVMGRDAAAAGLGGGPGGGDVVIVNTCAVTGEAERQARQTIRRLRRERPQARIIVTGCAAQTNSAGFAAMPEVDRVLGNDAKMRRDSWAEARRLFAAADFGIGREAKVAVNDIASVRETAGHLVEGLSGRARAYVQVQNGCDHRCTFCIIPYGRGNSRSVPAGAVVEEVRRLVDNGYREVVLTGVDLTSYGADLPGAPRLGTLVRQILKASGGLDRLRLSSLDCIEIDDVLMAAFAEEERLMPHLHLSLQSGDDLVLKRMKRRHCRADAVALCRQLRRLRPDMAFGADFIAGFPTETDDMFGRTLDMIEECGLTFLHVFPYSPRPGTPAARMPQVPRAVVKDRARRLRRHGDAALRRRLDAEVGQVRRVLVESDDSGHSEHFVPVRLARAVAPGAIVAARMSGHDGSRLIAQ
ncbi:MAG: tRNA (N(6)-L-threonylcarbamoyladenosine(37)-C(2))-methylthiotransferase MtaB [Bradyrhizobiaceae bacterium]|nr:tRNA (N(6)-L-threonylcarbamoyladenosine(37)-C(2))-methylthiotransferase MtaB [Bradyrhizobiaceae bacterium]